MKKLICLLFVMASLSACTTLKSKQVSFHSPKDYTNYQDISGLQVGAEAFSDDKLAKKMFGFDIRASGLLPVQLVLNNKSDQGIEIISGQTFLIDITNRYWKVLTYQQATAQIEKYAENWVVASGSSDKESAIGGAARNLQELAFGIVSGQNVSSPVEKAGTSDDSEGKNTGEGKEAVEVRQREGLLAEDTSKNSIDGKFMTAGSLASGFIFFPGEVSSANELRLQVKFLGDGRLKTLNLKLK